MITDPWFYAFAIPAVLLVGLSKSGFSGFGALGVPLMALTIPVPQAAAIMLPLLVSACFAPVLRSNFVAAHTSRRQVISVRSRSSLNRASDRTSAGSRR